MKTYSSILLGIDVFYLKILIIQPWFREWNMRFLNEFWIFKQNNSIEGDYLLSWVLECLFKLPDLVNCFPQTGHLNGRSPECTRLWSCRWPAFKNSRPHVSHLCSTALVAPHLCFFRCAHCLNVLLHTSHTYGRSSVWVLSWQVKASLRLNDFSQCGHWNDPSVLWVRRCLVRLSFRLNLLSHCSHWWGYSALWVWRCLVKSLFFENSMAQMLQENFFSLRWTASWCCFKFLSNVKRFPHTSHSHDESGNK